jgi:hypothetical protein
MAAEHSEDIVEVRHQDYAVPSLLPESQYPPLEVDDDLFTLLNTDFANEYLQPVTPHISHTEGESGTHETGVEDSDDDDLAFSIEVIDLDNEQELEDRGFGNEEQVHIASDSHKWKIDHSKGEHRLAGMRSSS